MTFISQWIVIPAQNARHSPVARIFLKNTQRKRINKMKIRIRKSKLKGNVIIPGSKSHTIRGLIFGMLAHGNSELISPLYSADTLSCMEGCRVLGAKIDMIEGYPNKIKIKGVEGRPNPRGDFIDVGNSGTSLRLLTGAASLCSQKIILDGDESTRTRPMQPLLIALKNLGVYTESVKNNGKCPVIVKGPIKGGETEVQGLSSQYLSSLLINCPLALKDSAIKVQDLHEKPYVEITLSWLKNLGIKISHENMEIFRVNGGQKYDPFIKRIPADFSTACFPLCAAAVTGSEITITGLDFSDTQGDKIIFEHLKNMGVSVETSGDMTIVRAEASRLKGMEIDMNATPDALPVMAVVGCFAKGRTLLKNVAQARIKECDRIAAMTRELSKMGAKIEELSDGMIIHQSSLHGAEAHGYSDHRIVMALSIAGMAAEGETIVDTAESAGVTYPEFIHDMQNLGVELEKIN